MLTCCQDVTAPLLPSITALTSNSQNPLTTTTITHVAVLPEYPITSEGGYTYCVAIDPRTATQEKLLKIALQVLLSSKHVGIVLTTRRINTAEVNFTLLNTQLLSFWMELLYDINIDVLE